MLSWVEQCAPLSYNDVAGNHLLVWKKNKPVIDENGPHYEPENFLIPSRLPGEPP